MVNFYPWLAMVYHYNSKIRSARFGFRFNQAAGSLLCLFYYWIFVQWNPLCPWKNWLFGFKVICGKLSYCGTFHVIFLRNLVQVQCFCCGFNFWHWTCFWFSNKCLVSWNCSLEEEIYFVSLLAKNLITFACILFWIPKRQAIPTDTSFEIKMMMKIYAIEIIFRSHEPFQSYQLTGQQLAIWLTILRINQ